MSNDLPEFLSVAQAAPVLHITPRAVLHRITSGKIAATKLGPGTAGYVITRAELLRVLDAEKQAS